jgi:hypothetical protein
MARKPKFKPIVTRVKLNPEQAVLACGCYNGGWNYTSTGFAFYSTLTACSTGRNLLVNGSTCWGPSSWWYGLVVNPSSPSS